jgi:surface polysaccharide O-acyltransferase-like enzyme
MWQIMCGYLIVVKIVAKTRPSCKCYRNGQRMNMYMLTIYIIHNPFGEVIQSHYLQLHVECNFMYAIKEIFVVNVGSNCFNAN